MPLEGWSKYIGKKTHVLLGRGSIQSKFALNLEELRLIIGKDSLLKMTNTQHIERYFSVRVKPKEEMHGIHKIVVGDPEPSETLYKITTKPINGKPRGPTTGFREALRVLLSRFCTELDIYGMSPNCGGKYYDLSLGMKLHHSCELESWALHYLMKASYDSTKLCVFI